MAQNFIRITLCTFAVVALCSAAFNYPTYSLDNMPTTKFTCRDKILGGYYADAETQCQMFHVCVKVAGVGVQDFRFLCPNGTAFDQEAQTCADWGDVDCEAATLYYGSDNFDLYRVASGFESKRAPYPDEEEATFHLQRAETSDARRSKQVVINQKTKVQSSTPNYHSTNSHFSTFNSVQTFDKTTSRYQPNSLPPSTSSRPSTPTPPRPTTTTTSTTTTTTTTTTSRPPLAPLQPQFNGQQMNYQEAIHQSASPAQNYNPYAAYNNNNNNAQSTRLNAYPSPTASTTTTTTAATPRAAQQNRQSFFTASTSTPIIQYHLNDDIFRGSYSSNFFNNKNNGKEDFESEFVETKKKPTTSTTKATQKPSNRGRLINRGRVTYNSSQRGPGQNNFNVIGNSQKPAVASYQTPVTTTSRPTTAAAVTRIQNVNGNGRQYESIRTNQQRGQQAAVTPITYRPSTISSSSFRVPTAQTTTAAPVNPEDQFYDVPRKVTTKTAPPTNTFLPTTVRPSAPQSNLQPFPSKFNPNANYDLTAVQQSKFTYNPHGEPRVSPSIGASTASSFFPSTTTSTTTTTTTPPAPKVPLFPTPAPIHQSSPRGFEVIPITLQSQPKQYQNQPQRPQPFSRRADTKNYTPSSNKKFSTLVPRELYDPTTFKPATYKKPVDNLAAIKTAQREQHSKYTPTNFVTPPSTTTSTTTTTSSPIVVNYSPVQNTFRSTQSPFLQQPSSFAPQSNGHFPQNTFNAPPPQFQAAALVQNFPTTIAQQLYSTAAPSYSNNHFNSFHQVSSSAAPLRAEDIDENDGQYHPELYEKDFARYKIKNRKANKIVSPAAQYINFQTTPSPASRSTGLRTNYQKPVVAASGTVLAGSGEEEFLKTAHSQNIVASGNQLLLDTIKNGFKQQQQQQQQQRSTAAQKETTLEGPRPFSRTAPTIPPNATSTKRPVKAKAEKDVSYDYQYYDFGVDGSSHRDYEFDLLEDFGKLNSKKQQQQQQKKKQ